MKLKRSSKPASRKRTHAEKFAAVSTAWKDGVAERASRMEARAVSTNGGTRKRAIPLVMAGFAGLFGMVGLVSQNALAVNFTGSNQLHYVYSDKVVGVENGIYIDKQNTQNGGQPAAQIGFANAQLSGFCMIAPQDVPGFGTIQMKLTAGEPVDGNPTTAAGVDAINIDSLYLAADTVLGDGSNISNMYVGRNAADIPVDTGLAGFAGVSGGFAITADTMDVTNFSSSSRAINIAGPLTLPGLKISVSMNSNTPTVADCG